MWWNEEQDILDIIGGAKECLLDASGLEATINTDDDVPIEAVRYLRVYGPALPARPAKTCVVPEPAVQRK
jgi:hypothetical protein